jgi:GT2 family glycosyltransferase
LLLNPDVRMPVGGLEALIDWMDLHPRVGVASPDIDGLEGAWESPGRAMPSIARTLLELSRLHLALPSKLRGRFLRGPYWTGGDQLDAGWVPGTAMIVRPQAVRQVGNLREDLFIYGEDLEWCARMRRGGWGVGVCTATTFTHRTSSSVRISFGEDEKERRIAEGIDAACRVMYGSVHARVLAAVTALSLAIEARAPRREAVARKRTHDVAKIWWTLAMQRK